MLKNSSIMIFMLSVILFVTACSSEQLKEQPKTEVDVSEKTSNEKDDETDELDSETSMEEIDEEIDEKLEAKEPIDEEPTYIYQLKSDHTVVPIEEGNEQVVLLTIDDAPDKYSIEMAKVLKDLDINAIFFVNGHFINNEVGRAELLELHEMGFEIGNHSMSHPNLSKLNDDKQREEIVALNDLIEEITGERPRFFRAPFGVNTDASKQITKEENMQWMNWSYGYDFVNTYMEKEALENIMVNAPELRSGANLLMHDRQWTLEALPEIIVGLKEKGYEFVDPKVIK